MSDPYDLVVIGFGSAGMVASEFAAFLKLRVAVVERARAGGDCLWTGCVPSKALLASAKVAHHIRHADRWGLEAREPVIDTSQVWARIRAVQERIAADGDSPARFEALGVEVVWGDATITGPNQVRVGDRRLDTRYILVCTGSSPRTPPIEGLADAGYVTSANLFTLDRAPASLIVVGGGPIAMEMAQGLTRLGTAVTVLQKDDRILTRDEPALVEVLARRLADEGVEIRLGVAATRVTREGDGGRTVHGTCGGAPASWTADEILVAAGRTPNIDGLGLDALGVEVGPAGVCVDERLRTNVDSIYVAGDAAGRYLFTHSAGYEGVRAVRDAFFPGKGKADELIPWCTFTDPELAHAGMTSAQATERFGDDTRVWRQDLRHNDRALADGADEGAIVVVTGPKHLIVGAHILAPNAGEMIGELALAIREKLRLARIAGLVQVYPTLSSGIGQLAAGAAFEDAARYGWLVRRGHH